MEDTVRQAIEKKARETGITSEPYPRRDLSPAAVAGRKARMERVVQEIASMPVLDPRSPREIMDELNAV